MERRISLADSEALTLETSALEARLRRPIYRINTVDIKLRTSLRSIPI